MTLCVQEEERLIVEEGERVNLTVHGKKKVDQPKNKGKILAQPIIKKESKCFFCKKRGHMKKDWLKFKSWMDKKGTLFAFVGYESNMVSTNRNTWWIDYGSTIHVSNTFQGMENLRRPIGSSISIQEAR